MSEALAGFLLANVAGALAVAVVLALRLPIRRWFGAQVTYRLWWLAPLAIVVVLLPARVVTVEALPEAPASVAAQAAPAAPRPSTRPEFEAAPWFLALWAAGMLASGALLVRRQAQFARAAQVGRAGPAAVGVLKPRIVLPADFEARYTPRERQMILAHEATHIARHDPRINALVAAARCAAWFNPLAHLAARYLRIDQELACDAAVVRAHPAARRSYAEAMLKTQLAARPLPLGCYWPSAGAHPLAQRVALLARALPGWRRRWAGTAAVALVALACGGFVWGARPDDVVIVPARITATLAAPRPAVQPTPAPAPTPTPTPDVRSESAEPQPIVQAVDAPLQEAPAPAEVAAPLRSFNIQRAAGRSHVEPGSAVRLVASMTDPDGRELVTDLTAYGSQRAYRTGYFERSGSRYSLFTSVDQDGDRLRVTASMGPAFAPRTAGTITLASGQTGAITLPNGQTVTVTPTLRAETPEEVDGGRRMRERLDRARLVNARLEPDLLRCGLRGAIC